MILLLLPILVVSGVLSCQDAAKDCRIDNTHIIEQIIDDIKHSLKESTEFFVKYETDLHSFAIELETRLRADKFMLERILKLRKLHGSWPSGDETQYSKEIIELTQSRNDMKEKLETAERLWAEERKELIQSFTESLKDTILECSKSNTEWTNNTSIEEMKEKGDVTAKLCAKKNGQLTRSRNDMKKKFETAKQQFIKERDELKIKYKSAEEQCSKEKEELLRSREEIADKDTAIAKLKDLTKFPEDMNYEFKGGSLLTIYLKYRLPDYVDYWEKCIDVDLYEGFSWQQGNYLHFRLDASVAYVASNFKTESSHFQLETEEYPDTYKSPSQEEYWRFDLYKLNETTFLPFFQGFNAHLRANLAALKISSVHLKTHVDNMIVPNFDKSNVYMTYRLPNKFTPNPEIVLAALDQPAIANNKSKKTTFLVIASLRRKEHSQALGDIRTESYVIEEDACTGTTTSTDIVHVKLERPDRTTIKMRIYFKGGSAGGITCQINVGDAEAAYLDKPLSVKGVQSATLLYIDV